MQALRAGQQIPDKILNAPTVPLGCEIYITAFFDLDSERTHKDGVTPIPWTSIAKYCEFNGFSWEQTCDTFHHVKLMDRSHMERLEAKLKAERDASKAKARSKRAR